MLPEKEVSRVNESKKDEESWLLKVFGNLKPLFKTALGILWLIKDQTNLLQYILSIPHCLMSYLKSNIIL